MIGFKLLGLKTGNRIVIKGNPTEKDYLKVLKQNTYYGFYSSFEFNEKTETFTYYPEKDVDLYSKARKNNNEPLYINISAIVGENGAGKSTLIELLFLSIHNLAAACKILKNPDNDKLNSPIEGGVHLDIFYSIDDKIYCIKLNGLDVTYSSQFINKDNSISKFQNFKIFESKTKSDLKFFFYSIAINYSLYGLNTNHIGEWIRVLFHKNDGYQTPLVINPMRDEGKIDINTEEYLAKSRLLSNLLIDSKSKEHLELTHNQIATALTFTLNRDKIQNIYYHKWSKHPYEYTFKKLYSDYSNKSDLLDVVYDNLIQIDKSVNVKFKAEIESYIVKKLFKIARTYDKYKVFLTDNSKDETIQPAFYKKGEQYSLENYISELKKDSSHITFKLNQAINYIKNNPLAEDEEYKWNTENNQLYILIKDLAKRINTKKLSEIINLIPPSLFNLEIHIEEKEDRQKKSVFSGLSSGEQQLIHSVQSILYHIININSVFYNNSLDGIEYKYLNLMLDEIELYFHPAHQKKFIQYILKGMKSLDVPKIKGINLLFSTHSPFILSDIPASNILRLRKGKSVVNNQLTFGANIHDLLANDFFLEKSFMGDFAKRKINKTINWINKQKKLKDLDNLNITDSFIKKREKHKKIIELIGEPVLRIKLIHMLSELDNDKTNFKKMIKNEIEMLNNLIKD